MKVKSFKFNRGPHHILARLVCLLLAVLVWLFVMRIASPMYDETYRDIKVEVEESDILSEYTGRVDGLLTVRVWGTKEALHAYGPEDIRAYVKIADLADAEGIFSAGKTYELPVYFDLPDGLEVRQDHRVPMLLEAR